MNRSTALNMTSPRAGSSLLSKLLPFIALMTACFSLTGCLEENTGWPPRLGQSFPDLQLIDHTGREFRLGELKGKVILVEPVGMNCAACNAFAGGQQKGGYNGMRPQQGLQSIESYLPQFARGIDIGNPDLKLVQLLLYDFNMRQPTAEDAKLWAEHFGLDQHENILVVVSTTDLRGKPSFDMIPGFQLVDREFILRRDATGNRPQHNLFGDLLPMIPDLVWG